MSHGTQIAMLDMGTQVGPYEIVSPLGAGGMGEVYRAKDLRLERSVALKILPIDPLHEGRGPDRFLREARAAGQIDHPNILTIHDVGVWRGQPYIVSEHLEGQTLRALMQSGPVPARRVLEYGIQIARGLGAAHQHGIVHRDLKPENLFVTSDGRVKILDFGLAKPVKSGVGITKESTETGLVLGTVGYMAPEQVLGGQIDHRADIFAFGAILYEMLTGKRAFDSATPVATLHAIVHGSPPDLLDVTPMTPPALSRVVGRCLEKQSEQRFQSASDIAFDLEFIAENESGSQWAISRIVRRAVRSTSFRWAVAAGTLLMLGLGVSARPWLRGRTPLQFTIAAPVGTTFEGYANAAVSPDGTALVLAVSDSAGVSRLWVRRLRSVVAEPLAGTEGAFYPFWSPDSRSIGFFVRGKLRRVNADGGAVVDLCEASAGRGGTWSPGGWIVFAPHPEGPLSMVPEVGGPPSEITTVDSTRGEFAHRWPQFLPDGRHFTYLSLPPSGEEFDVFVGSTEPGMPDLLMSSGSAPVYAPPGYLLFLRERTLFAQRFDQRKRSLVGGPLAVAEAPRTRGALGEPNATASANGTLAFVTAGEQLTNLVWIDRLGKTVGTIPMPNGAYFEPRLRPDGRAFAVSRGVSGTEQNLWIFDVNRGGAARETFEPALERFPVWAPDGSKVCMASNRSGKYDLYVQNVGGAGSATSLDLASATLLRWPTDWTADGKYVIYEEISAEGGYDLWMVDPNSPKTARAYLASPFNEREGRCSPAGRWMAYVSNESGRDEVYVQSFPEPGTKQKISTGGGASPCWGRDGKELFYVSGRGTIMVVSFEQRDNHLQVSLPEVLFERSSMLGFDTVDGQQFICALPANEVAASSVILVLDWEAGLRD